MTNPVTEAMPLRICFGARDRRSGRMAHDLYRGTVAGGLVESILRVARHPVGVGKRWATREDLSCEPCAKISEA